MLNIDRIIEIVHELFVFVVLAVVLLGHDLFDYGQLLI